MQKRSESVWTRVRQGNGSRCSHSPTGQQPGMVVFEPPTGQSPIKSPSKEESLRKTKLKFSPEVYHKVIQYLEDHTDIEASQHFRIPVNVVKQWENISKRVMPKALNTSPLSKSPVETRKQKPVTTRKRRNRTYPEDFKITVAKFAVAHSLDHAVTEYKVARSTIAGWLHLANESKKDDEGSHKKLSKEKSKEITGDNDLKIESPATDTESSPRARLAYGLRFKQKVAKYAMAHNAHCAVSKFGVSISSVKKWRRQFLIVKNQQNEQNVQSKVGKFTKYSVNTKKTVGRYASRHGVSLAASKFGIPATTVFEWRKKISDGESLEHCPRKKITYKYSTDFRKKVVKYAREHSMVKALTVYHVAYSTLYKWMQSFPSNMSGDGDDQQTSSKITSAINTGSRGRIKHNVTYRLFSYRQQFKELNRRLTAEVNQELSKSQKLNRHKIEEMARVLAEELKISRFRASDGWYYGFLETSGLKQPIQMSRSFVTPTKSKDLTKSSKKQRFKELNRRLTVEVKQELSKSQKLNRYKIEEMARVLAEELNISPFRASDGWYYAFLETSGLKQPIQMSRSFVTPTKSKDHVKLTKSSKKTKNWSQYRFSISQGRKDLVLQYALRNGNAQAAYFYRIGVERIKAWRKELEKANKNRATEILEEEPTEPNSSKTHNGGRSYDSDVTAPPSGEVISDLQLLGVEADETSEFLDEMKSHNAGLVLVPPSMKESSSLLPPNGHVLNSGEVIVNNLQPSAIFKDDYDGLDGELPLISETKSLPPEECGGLVLVPPPMKESSSLLPSSGHVLNSGEVIVYNLQPPAISEDDYDDGLDGELPLITETKSLLPQCGDASSSPRSDQPPDFDNDNFQTPDIDSSVSPSGQLPTTDSNTKSNLEEHNTSLTQSQEEPESSDEEGIAAGSSLNSSLSSEVVPYFCDMGDASSLPDTPISFYESPGTSPGSNEMEIDGSPISNETMTTVSTEGIDSDEPSCSMKSQEGAICFQNSTDLHSTPISEPMLELKSQRRLTDGGRALATVSSIRNQAGYYSVAEPSFNFDMLDKTIPNWRRVPANDLQPVAFDGLEYASLHDFSEKSHSNSLSTGSEESEKQCLNVGNVQTLKGPYKKRWPKMEVYLKNWIVEELKYREVTIPELYAKIRSYVAENKIKNGPRNVTWCYPFLDRTGLKHLLCSGTGTIQQGFPIDDQCSVKKEELMVSSPVSQNIYPIPSPSLREVIEYAQLPTYNPPSSPFEIPDFHHYIGNEFEFGKTAKSQHFFLATDSVFLDHVSHGAVLKEGLDVSHSWQRYAEQHPGRFFNKTLAPQLSHAQKKLAEFIDCEASNLRFVSDSATAFEHVFQSLQLKRGNKIYCLNITDETVKKMIWQFCVKSGAEIQEETVCLQLQSIIGLVESTLDAKTTLAVFDHVSRDHGFVLPLKQIVAICHSIGVPVLINGSHGFGMWPLNLRTLDADYYIGDCRWLCGPRGCGFLYTKHELQKGSPARFDSGPYSQFLLPGSKDYSAYLSLPTVLNFWNSVGAEKIRTRCRKLLAQAVELLICKWNIELITSEQMHGMMCCVPLPSLLHKNTDQSLGEQIQNQLSNKYDIEVPVNRIQGRLYVRISSHIYNEIQDFEKLADAVLEISSALRKHPGNFWP